MTAPYYYTFDIVHPCGRNVQWRASVRARGKMARVSPRRSQDDALAQGSDYATIWHPILRRERSTTGGMQVMLVCLNGGEQTSVEARRKLLSLNRTLRGVSPYVP